MTSGAPEHAVVVGDVDQVQRFVFSTNHLRTIRGASRLLEMAAKKAAETVAAHPAMPGQSAVQVLRITGGEIVVRVPADRAAAVADSLASEFAKQVHDGAHLTVAHAAESATDGFAGALDRARRVVRRLKEQEPLAPNAGRIAPPLARRCAFAAIEPAEAVLRMPDGSHKHASRVARACWKLGTGGQAGFVTQLDEMFESGGFVAYVAADGNGAGEWVRTTDAETFRADSTSLTKAMADAVAEAINVAGTAAPRPIVPVVAAGDDLAFVVRADLVVGTVLNAARKAESLRREGTGLTLSIGIAIARESTPIRLLRDLASSLQADAKRAAREDPTTMTTRIRFAYLTAGTTGAAGDAARPVAAPAGGAERMALTLAEWGRVGCLAAELATLPRSRWKRVAQSIARASAPRRVLDDWTKRLPTASESKFNAVTPAEFLDAAELAEVGVR